MKKVLKFTKKYSHTIVGIIILVFIVVLGVFAKNFFFPNDAEAYYGTRLEGIDKIKITSKRMEEIKGRFNGSAKSTSVRVQGRIIYINVKVNDDVDTDTAKYLSDLSLEKLSDDEKAYYDIQFIFKSDVDKDHFPIIGYKHHTKSGISWTKNR
ncbi:MAG: hypothetical protein IK137_04100 [Bacilli bacterium]|nr:hypothetical protein [Bacilli bacterium]